MTTHPAARRQAPSRRANLIVALCTTWLVGGLLLDAWAHTTKPDLESFWTPWHGVMYAGGAACIMAIGLLVVRNVERGVTLREAVPIGYEPASLGIGLLVLSGVGDMVWHTVFGIEENLRIFFSPTHITLIIAICLIASAPWRAVVAAQREASSSWAHAWPAVLSGVSLIAAISVISQFAGALAGNPLRIDGADELRDIGLLQLFQNLGIVSVLGTILVMTLVTGAIRRSVHLPLGATTVMCASAGACLASTSEWGSWETVLAAGIGGLFVEIADRLPVERDDWRELAANVGLGLGFAGALVALTAARYGLPYEAELWTGTILWAGVLSGGVALVVRRTLSVR